MLYRTTIRTPAPAVWIAAVPALVAQVAPGVISGHVYYYTDLADPNARVKVGNK
jgi:hypothetical protein